MSKVHWLNYGKNLLIASIAFSAYAGDEIIDGKEYWRDPDGNLHQYLYFNSFTSDTPWPNFRSTREVQDPPESISWTSSAVLVFEKDTVYQGALNINVADRTACGYRIEKQPSRFEGWSKSVGAYGIHSEVSGVRWLWYPGVDRHYELTASQTWSGPTNVSELSSAPFFFAPGSTEYRSYATRGTSFVTADGITLTLAGDMVVMMYSPTNDFSKCDVVIQKPALLSLIRHNHLGRYLSAEMRAKSITFDGGIGMYFGTQKTIGGVTVDYPTDGTVQTGIGSEPVIDPVHVSALINLKNGATLTATETTVVSGGVTIAAIDGTASAFTGAYRFDDDLTTIHVAAGSSLDLSAATFSGSGRVTITGAGTVRLGGTGIQGFDDSFRVDSSATVKIEIASGSYIFGAGTDLPAAVCIDTLNEGAMVFADPTGFDYATRLGGTKRLVDDGEGSMIVTEKARENETVTVPEGGTLYVWGSGLKASSTVRLVGTGASATATAIKFCRTASLAAELKTTGCVRFTSSGKGVTGSLAGLRRQFNTESSSLYFRAEDSDKLVLSGDWSHGELKGSGNWVDTIRMEHGELEITGQLVSKELILHQGGHIKVCDGGTWTISGGQCHYYMNSSQAEPTCLEIATGGSFTITGENCYMYLSGTYPATLRINGGTYTHWHDWFYLGALGTLEVLDGTFTSARRITVKDTTGTSRVILGGGQFVPRDSAYAATLFDGTGHTDVIVRNHATLDLSSAYSAAYADTPADAPAATWTCEPGAALTVKGKTNGNGEFTMRDFKADGLVFDLAPQRQVVKLGGLGTDLSLGWQMPGASGSKVVAIEPTPNLVASYVVPVGERLDVGNFPTAWYEGFALSATANLTFEEGSEIRFPCFGEGAVPTVTGKVMFPSAMNFSVDCTGPRKTVKDVAVFSAAEMSGASCSWTCVGGVRTDRASVAADGNSLEFSYDAPGVLMMVR